MKIELFDKSKTWKTSNRHFIVSNDTLDAINDLTLSNIPFSEQNSAILVGNSYLFSLLPLLQNKIKKFYICDMDLSVLNLIHYMFIAVKMTKEKRDFIKNLIATISENNKNFFNSITALTIERFLNKEVKKLGHLHFLHNEDNFQNLKKSIDNIEIKLLKINLFDNKQVNRLAFLLNKKQEKIAFANFTNLGDYYHIEEDGKHLSSLPFTDDCKIAYSIINFKFVQANLFSKGIQLWLSGYERRKKIYLAFLKCSEHLEFAIRNKLIQKILSGHPGCIDDCHELGISLLDYACITKPNLELLRALLTFPIAKKQVESILSKNNMDEYFISEINFYKKYAIKNPLGTQKIDSPIVKKLVKELNNYIDQRTYRQHDVYCLSWISRNVRNPMLTRKKVELAIELREKLIANQFWSEEEIDNLVKSYKIENDSIEISAHKKYYFFTRSSLNYILTDFENSALVI